MILKNIIILTVLARVIHIKVTKNCYIYCNWWRDSCILEGVISFRNPTCIESDFIKTLLKQL